MIKAVDITVPDTAVGQTADAAFRLPQSCVEEHQYSRWSRAELDNLIAAAEQRDPWRRGMRSRHLAEQRVAIPGYQFDPRLAGTVRLTQYFGNESNNFFLNVSWSRWALQWPTDYRDKLTELTERIQRCIDGL